VTIMVKPKRFLMITEPCFPSSQMGDIAHAVVSLSGHEVIRLAVTNKYYLPVTLSGALSGLRLEMFGDYYNLSAPRLSLAEYQALCGDDIDFNKVSMKDDWRYANFNGDFDSLNPESIILQRLRGTAWRMENLIKAIRPAGLFIQQGCSPESLVMLSKGLSAGLPVLIMETGFLPGHVYFELYGMHFYRDWCRVDNLYREKALKVEAGVADALRQRIRDDILNRNISKFQQTACENEKLALEDFVKRFQEKVIFFPEQVSLDSNVFSALRELGVSRLEQLYRKVADSLPTDMGLVFKRHPKWTPTDRNDLRRDNVLFLDSLGLADIFRRAKAVVSLTSNVGLEAAVCGLPVLCLGASIYSGKGFTLDWDGEADLNSCLREILDFRPDDRAVAAFLYTLKKEVLFSPEEPPEDFDRLCRGDEFTPEPEPRAPFWKAGRGDFAAFQALKDSCAELYWKNYSYQEIMAKLGRPVVDSPVLHLFSGERQTAAQIRKTEPSHVARYALAGLFLPPKGQILDAGCGSGYGASFLAARTSAEILAFDACEEAVDFAGEVFAEPNITYQIMSAGAFAGSDMPADQGPFDLVTAFEFLEHIPSPETFVAQIKKRMSAGGVFIGSVPHNETYPLGDHPFHIRHYDLHFLKMMLDIQPDEYVRFFYQNAEEIGSDRSTGRSIIFVLTRDESKLRCLDGQMPFRPERIDDDLELFFPAALFGVAGADRAPIKGIPLAFDGPGFIFFGPYQAVPPGGWEVTFLFTAPASPLISFQDRNYSFTLDIVSSQGQTVYSRRECTIAELFKGPKMRIRVDSPEELLEFRLYAHGCIPLGSDSDGLLFKGVRLSRLADSLLAELPGPENRFVAIEAQRFDAERRLAEAEARLIFLYRSRSWRITRPLRGIVRVLRGDYKPFAALKQELKTII
jgi:2-polyprenyl-3-methyl-5-hydroxy-6-metoxy-1,4-benzoquinol methylase